MDVLVGDHDAERGAALAGRAEAGEQRALGGEVEVGVGHDDQRVLATQLEAGALQVPAAQLADAGADLGGAGEPDLLHQPLLQRPLEPLEGGRPVGVDGVEHARRQAAGDEQPGQGVGQRRRVVGRLPHHRVAAQQGRHEVPGRHRHGEVAGGDDAGDADRHPEGEQLLVAHLRRDRLAVQPSALAEEEVAGVDDLLHLPAGLGQRLADLADDQAGQRLGIGLDQPPDRGDHPAADGRGRRRPGGLGGPRRGEGGDELVGRRQLDLGDDVVEPGRVSRPGGARGAGDRAAADEGLGGHGSPGVPAAPAARGPGGLRGRR